MSEKPIISGFNQLASLAIQKYERYLPTAFDESMSILQKLNKIIEHLNDIGELTNSVVEQWNSVMEWVLSDGINESVTAKLDSMIADGSLSTLINETIFNDLNTKIDTATTDITSIKTDLTTINQSITNIDSTLSGVSNELKHTENFVNVIEFMVDGDTTINNAFKLSCDYAINKGFRKLFIPDGEWLVDPTATSPYYEAGLVVPSNFDLYLGNGCTLKSIVTDVPNYRILNLYNAENVNIYNGFIKGDRDSHIGVEGEWGIGLYLYLSKNINVYGTKISDCWGDGVYLGLGCEDVHLHNVVSLNNRRNNISLISCKTFRANNCKFNNANGTSPQAGADVEPNDIYSDLENIKFIDCEFKGNSERGFAVNIVQMLNANKKIDVEFIRPVVDGSNLGITIQNVAGNTGEIKIIDPRISNTLSRAIWLINPVSTGAKIIIVRPIIRDANTGRTTDTDPRTNGAIMGYCTDNNLTDSIGNTEIYEPYIASPNSMSCITFFDNRVSPQPINNLKIINPIKMVSAIAEGLTSSGYYKTRYWINTNRLNFYFRDIHETIDKQNVGALNYNNYHGLGTWWKGNCFYANANDIQVSTGLLLPATLKSEDITFTYENWGSAGLKITFRKETDQLQNPLKVFFENAGSTVRTITTTDIGARLKIKVTDQGIQVLEKTGVWTFAS